MAYRENNRGKGVDFKSILVGGLGPKAYNALNSRNTELRGDFVGPMAIWIAQCQEKPLGKVFGITITNPTSETGLVGPNFRSLFYAIRMKPFDDHEGVAVLIFPNNESEEGFDYRFAVPYKNGSTNEVYRKQQDKILFNNFNVLLNPNINPHLFSNWKPDLSIPIADSFDKEIRLSYAKVLPETPIVPKKALLKSAISFSESYIEQLRVNRLSVDEMTLRNGILFDHELTVLEHHLENAHEAWPDLSGSTERSRDGRLAMFKEGDLESIAVPNSKNALVPIADVIAWDYKLLLSTFNPDLH